MKTLLFALLIPIALLIAACSQENTAGGTGPTIIRGLVSDDNGPVPYAVVEATDEEGRLKATTTAGEDGRFRITIPTTAPYPLLLVARLPGNKELRAVVTDNGVEEQDISPHTDLVVKSARRMGGLTPENISRAAGSRKTQ